MTEPTRVHLLWHLHQPYYGLPGRHTNFLPWVRLHATKSYYDMGRMLERFPEVRATVNFSGSLLRQLREYVEDGRRDTWWDLTLRAPSQLGERERRHLVRHFFSIDWDHCVRPYPRYAELLERRGRDGDADPSRFSHRDLMDLQVWFNLAWFGFSAREERPVVGELIDKGAGFSQGEKEALLEQQIEVMRLIEPMYRELRARGQVEISVTPMYHPILPLIVDTDAAARATPQRPRPPRFQARADANEHVEQARQIAREFLSVDVDGMWPAEGSVSPEAVEIFSQNGVRWIATDEDVLARSLGSSYDRDRDLNRPWRLRGLDAPWIFFRDHGISDQIGFVYSKNEPGVAVDDFVKRLRQAKDERPDGAPSIVSVILDGENPWEHYPDDGREFLTELFSRLTDVPDLLTTTPARYLDDFGGDAELGALHSGSWIMGNYQIWIGHEETNRAWELLGRARSAMRRRIDEGGVDEDAVDAALEALRIAQGSDWFWWYGDDFTSVNDADFDRLFRDQLRFVYQVLGLEPPRELDDPIARTPAREIAFDPPRQLIQPRIDGKAEYFYEWNGAGVYRNTGAHGSMFENVRLVDEVHVGFDVDRLYVRIEAGPDLRERWEDLSVRLVVETERGRYQADLTADGGGTGFLTVESDNRVLPIQDVAIAVNVEVAIPFDDLDLGVGETFGLWFAIRDAGMQLERHPPETTLALEVPDVSFELRNWMV